MHVRGNIKKNVLIISDKNGKNIYNMIVNFYRNNRGNDSADQLRGLITQYFEGQIETNIPEWIFIDSPVKENKMLLHFSTPIRLISIDLGYTPLEKIIFFEDERKKENEIKEIFTKFGGLKYKQSKTKKAPMHIKDYITKPDKELKKDLLEQNPELSIFGLKCD